LKYCLFKTSKKTKKKKKKKEKVKALKFFGLFLRSNGIRSIKACTVALPNFQYLILLDSCYKYKLVVLLLKFGNLECRELECFASRTQPISAELEYECRASYSKVPTTSNLLNCLFSSL
jgi:hypothetical protein